MKRELSEMLSNRDADDYNNFTNFLSITRAEMYYNFIKPVSEILKNETLTVDEKIESIDYMSSKIKTIMNEWNVEDYGFKV